MGKEEIKAYPHRPLEGVFERHHTQLTLVGGDHVEDLGNVAAGVKESRMSQVFQAGEMGKGALRPQVGHALRALQGSRRRHDFTPQRTQVGVGQWPPIERRKPVQYFPLALRPENGSLCVGLDASHFKAQGGSLVEKLQQLPVDEVDFMPDGIQARGVFRAFLRFVIHGFQTSRISSAMRMPKWRPA